MIPTPSEHRLYRRSECATFRKTNERYGGLSNMAAGYPLKVNGVAILTSEALYQAFRFPHRPEVQKLIIAQASPMTAKMKSKPFRSDSRPDWDRVRVSVMRWCLRVKLAQHWVKFGSLLRQTGERPIVEDSQRDDFWGAKPDGDQLLKGFNVLGRLLMELRSLHAADTYERLKQVPPPHIPDALLFGVPIEGINTQSPVGKGVLVPNSSDAIKPRSPELTYELEPSATEQAEIQGMLFSFDDVEGVVERRPTRQKAKTGAEIRKSTRRQASSKSRRKKGG